MSESCKQHNPIQWEVIDEKRAILRCAGPDKLTGQYSELAFQLEAIDAARDRLASVTGIAANGVVATSEADIVNIMSGIDAALAQRARQNQPQSKPFNELIKSAPAVAVETPPGAHSIKGFYLGMESNLLYQQAHFLGLNCSQKTSGFDTGRAGGLQPMGPCELSSEGEFTFQLAENLEPNQVSSITFVFQTGDDWHEVINKVSAHFGQRPSDEIPEGHWNNHWNFPNGDTANLSTFSQGPENPTGNEWTLSLYSFAIGHADELALDKKRRATAPPTPKF